MRHEGLGQPARTKRLPHSAKAFDPGAQGTPTAHDNRLRPPYNQAGQRRLNSAVQRLMVQPNRPQAADQRVGTPAPPSERGGQPLDLLARMGELATASRPRGIDSS